MVVTGKKKQQAVLRRVLDRAPVSIRGLARAAGISHVSLIHARDGKIGLTADTLRALAKALRGWSRTCAALAEDLEDAARLTEGASDDGT